MDRCSLSKNRRCCILRSRPLSTNSKWHVGATPPTTEKRSLLAIKRRSQARKAAPFWLGDPSWQWYGSEVGERKSRRGHLISIALPRSKERRPFLPTKQPNRTTLQTKTALVDLSTAAQELQELKRERYDPTSAGINCGRSLLTTTVLDAAQSIG
jgi:hypothetical protein